MLFDKEFADEELVVRMVEKIYKTDGELTYVERSFALYRENICLIGIKDMKEAKMLVSKMSGNYSITVSKSSIEAGFCM